MTNTKNSTDMEVQKEPFNLTSKPVQKKFITFTACYFSPPPKKIHNFLHGFKTQLYDLLPTTVHHMGQS